MAVVVIHSVACGFGWTCVRLALVIVCPANWQEGGDDGTKLRDLMKFPEVSFGRISRQCTRVLHHSSGQCGILTGCMRQGTTPITIGRTLCPAVCFVDNGSLVSNEDTQ